VAGREAREILERSGDQMDPLQTYMLKLRVQMFEGAEREVAGITCFPRAI
jgi:hypothetical protein